MAHWLAWQLATGVVPGLNTGKGDNFKFWIKRNYVVQTI